LIIAPKLDYEPKYEPDPKKVRGKRKYFSKVSLNHEIKKISYIIVNKICIIL